MQIQINAALESKYTLRPGPSKADDDFEFDHPQFGTVRVMLGSKPRFPSSVAFPR